MPSIRFIYPYGKKTFLYILVSFCLAFTANAQSLSSDEVLIIFNNSVPDSAKLAGIYQKKRNVPNSQILGFDMPPNVDITRKEFETTLLEPLRNHFDKQKWWSRTRDQQGLLIPTRNRIRAIVLMHGVPLRIKPEPVPPNTEEKSAPTDPISHRDEASLDSELALFGVENLPTKGILKNPFYESDVSLSKKKIPVFVLVTRIDSSALTVSRRMITDAVETEKNGLWGRAYVDVANKFPEGDTWLENIVSKNREHGIPTITDRFGDTFPKNYPMIDAALYYGWYNRDMNGPFLNPTFQFRPGAIAVHIHSFSAEQIRDPHKNWVAPLLLRGATAALGDVYEPYLQLTYHTDIFHDRLLKGWTLAEAAWASIPATSWQGVVFGDPLYRPFLHISGTGENLSKDRDFRVLAAASREWPKDDSKRREKLASAAEKLSSGNLAEGLAIDYLESKDIPNAQVWFKNAQGFFTEKDDKLRQDLSLIAIDRMSGQNPKAISDLRTAKQTYGNIPAADSLSAWLDILDPPPPPIADPTKLPE